MTLERQGLLGELLKEVEAEGGFIPDPAYRPLQRLCSWAAVEVFIVSKDGQKVLLRHRNDDPWDGWHVIGGYVKPKESIQQFCNRALREDTGSPSGVIILGQIATSKWLDHPFTFPFCSVILCNLVEEIIECKDFRFFHVSELPMCHMLHPKHVLYLETYLNYLKHPERICPIIGE